MVSFQKMRKNLVLLCLAASFSFAGATHATTYSQLVVFGDSLSDSGNVFDLFGGAFGPNPPYAEARFTSDFADGTAGLVWVEHLANLMGLSLDNSIAGGTNYAHGGARAVEVPFDFIPSLPEQAGTYLSDVNNVADPNALYVVFGGGNDVRDNDIQFSVSSIAGIITDLAEAGATSFLVPNLPDIGLTPEALAGDAPGGSSEVITAAADSFNSELAGTLEVLETELGINIIDFDLNAIFAEIIEDPAGFGVENVTDSCFDGVNLCSDTDAFLFFDGIHPTAITHLMMGELAYQQIKAVPVPAALPLMLSALGLLGLRRRRSV